MKLLNIALLKNLCKQTEYLFCLMRNFYLAVDILLIECLNYQQSKLFNQSNETVIIGA
jgi:hypothetical protein